MRILFCLLFVIVSTSVSAQKWKRKKIGHTEFGFFRGFSTYYGDLANKGDFINLKDKGDALGAFVRMNTNNWHALRFSFMTGRISGSDADAKDPYELRRNLSFKNDIREFSVISEVSLMEYDMCYSSALYAPYVFLGFALYLHNPVAELNGQDYDLVGLRTEGQNTFPYNGPPSYERWDDGGTGGYRGEYYLTQISIPIGVGFKYRFYRNSTIAFELGIRKTWFDYLDDVSKSYISNPIGRDGNTMSSEFADRSAEGQEFAEGDLRGTKKGSDYYTFLGITLSFSSVKCGSKNPIKCFSFNKWS